VFRSYRDNDISCFDAVVRPEFGRTEDGNYNHCASVEVTCHFDQVG
jgi:plastocyanin domain-containing protein